MKLTIRFVGLCLYAARNGRVHVLMPEAHHTSGGRIPEHEPSLQIYNGYTDGTGVPRPDEYSYKEFPHRQLWIMPPSGSPDDDTADPKGPKSEELAPLDVLSGKSLPAAVFGGTPTNLGARVTLTRGKKCGSLVGARFALGNTERRLCIEFSWSMNVPHRRITLALTDFLDEGERPRSDAEFIDLESSTNEMCLAVFYVPEKHRPPNKPKVKEPEIDDVSPHFEAYYALYDNNPTIVLPRYRGQFAISDGPDGNNCERCGLSLRVLGGDPVTCVGGGT
jgi:hypothetical protein